MVHITKKDLKKLLSALKCSAKRRGIEFDLTITDLNNLSFPITCPILGIELKFNQNQAEDCSYSLDRIDSTKGYIKDNIVVISMKANRMKNNGTSKEMQQLVEFYKKFAQ